MAKGDAAVVLQQQEDVAGDQVGLLQFFADGLGQPGQLQRYRLAVDQPYPADLGHQAALLDL
ncbi:hypothetical protein D3C76_1496170 [compost metagenome]